MCDDVSVSVQYHAVCVALHICLHQVGHTALMRAAFWGHTKVVTELVKGGADLNLQNKVFLFMYYMYIHYMTHHDAIQLRFKSRTF